MELEGVKGRSRRISKKYYDQIVYLCVFFPNSLVCVGAPIRYVFHSLQCIIDVQRSFEAI